MKKLNIYVSDLFDPDEFMEYQLSYAKVLAGHGERGGWDKHEANEAIKKELNIIKVKTYKHNIKSYIEDKLVPKRMRRIHSIRVRQ